MFSIIVPSYNRNEQIEQLLKNLATQSRYNFEVVIVDDHSTIPVCINDDYPFEVHIIRNESNHGAAKSRNIGVANANYEWLMFLDDDDLFLAEKCEILANIITQNPKVNFIYHPAECVMVNEKFNYLTHPCQNIENITLDNLLACNIIGGIPMLAMKKTLFNEVNGLSEDLLALEDYELLLKLVKTQTFNPLYLPAILTKCFFYTQKMSVSKNIKNTEHAIQKIKTRHVTSPLQAQLFERNTNNLLGYAHLMNYSRNAARYYFNLFKEAKSIKYLLMSILSFISPRCVINLKRYL